MRKERLLQEVQRNKLLEDSGISLVGGAQLMSVDIQPAYEDWFSFDKYSFGKMINESYESMASLTFLFNGPDLGFPSEEEYKWWLMEDCEIDEEILAASYFYDKGYAFFRYCMDNSIDDDELVDFIKFLIQHNINDSREVDEEMWNSFTNEYGHTEIRDLLESVDDMINIPDLMEYLQNFRGNIMLCGGGIKACLKEVELALMALDKNYNILTKYTY